MINNNNNDDDDDDNNNNNNNNNNIIIINNIVMMMMTMMMMMLMMLIIIMIIIIIMITTTTTTTTTTTAIIVIAFKGAIRDFDNLLTAPRTVSNTYAQVARAQSCANHVHTSRAYHVKHVVLRATWYEGTVQLLRQSLNSIYFSFI